MAVEGDLIGLAGKQLASSLVRAIAAAKNFSTDDIAKWRFHESMLHFHDGSQTPIAWNDVQAISSFNQVLGENIPVPLVASEGYNQHHHASEYDGGYLPGMGIHDHRDNVTGQGFAFAVFHPGTSLPQIAFAT